MKKKENITKLKKQKELRNNIILIIEITFFVYYTIGEK